MNANVRTVSEGAALAHFDAVAAIEQPHGKLLVEVGSARDHADMRADQLESLLLLMRKDDGRQFRDLSEDRQLSMLWLAWQLAADLKAVLPIVAMEV